MEQKLLDFCDELHLRVSITPKSNEIFGKGIKRAFKFLSQAKNYEIHQAHWLELVYISKLRNLLVHEGKQLELSYVKQEGPSVVYRRENELDIYLPIGEDLFGYLDKHKLFEVSGVYLNIIPSIEYCKKLVNVMCRFRQTRAWRS